MRKTYHGGYALDKFLFLPGSAVLEPSLRMDLEADEMGKGEGSEAQFFQATTFAGEQVGNHHPVHLEIPHGQEELSKPVKTLKLKSLSKERWARKNTQFF